jgi:hypothetical protein
MYPLTFGRFFGATTRQTTSRPCGFERMTACPGGKLLVSRRTAPLSKTMTVLASSLVGLDGPGEDSGFSLGRLRIVTLTSKQTGLERGVCSVLFSVLTTAEPDLFKLSNEGGFLERQRPGIAIATFLRRSRATDSLNDFRMLGGNVAIVRGYYDVKNGNT